jgi:hypothetical protein
LWYRLTFGSYLLYFAGAITGGLWGVFWEQLFGPDNPIKTYLSKSPKIYYIIEIILIII